MKEIKTQEILDLYYTKKKEYFDKIFDADSHKVINKNGRVFKLISRFNEEEKEILRIKVNEIKAMLSACDTYEQEMKILETYSVVKDGKLSI